MSTTIQRSALSGHLVLVSRLHLLCGSSGHWRPKFLLQDVADTPHSGLPRHWLRLQSPPQILNFVPVNLRINSDRQTSCDVKFSIEDKTHQKSRGETSRSLCVPQSISDGFESPACVHGNHDGHHSRVLERLNSNFPDWKIPTIFQKHCDSGLRDHITLK